MSVDGVGGRFKEQNVDSGLAWVSNLGLRLQESQGCSVEVEAEDAAAMSRRTADTLRWQLILMFACAQPR